MYDEYNVETCVAVNAILYIRRSLRSDEELASPEYIDTPSVSLISNAVSVLLTSLASKTPFI